MEGTSRRPDITYQDCRSLKIRPKFDLVERPLDSRTRLVAPIGDLDAATNPAFRDAVRTALASTRRLVVDLSQVAFISAATLGIIARADAFLEGRSGELLVICPNPAVRRLFEIAGLDRQLQFIGSTS